MTLRPPLADGLHAVGPGKLACVVTSLEMARPATIHPSVARPDLRLRPVPGPDPAWYRDLFRRVGAPWLWSSRLDLGGDALWRLLVDPAVAVFAVEHAGEDAGLLELDFRAPGACEIAFFGLVPALTGRGAGGWLMAHALGLAWARPIERLWVHTCTLDHPAALPFYMRSGFRPFRTEVEVLDDPRRTGALDATAAPQVPLL